MTDDTLSVTWIRRSLRSTRNLFLINDRLFKNLSYLRSQKYHRICSYYCRYLKLNCLQKRISTAIFKFQPSQPLFVPQTRRHLINIILLKILYYEENPKFFFGFDHCLFNHFLKKIHWHVFLRKNNIWFEVLLYYHIRSGGIF